MIFTNTDRAHGIAILLACLLLALPSLTVANPDYADDDEDEDYDYSSLPYVEIENVEDFEALGKLASDQKRIILLEMTATHCGYCELLEEEVLKPMLRSGDYTDTVLIRQLKVDSNLMITDFDGSETTPARFSSRYRIFVTPTLLVLDGRGHEISERLIGVQSLDFYAGLVDKALQSGLTTTGKSLPAEYLR